MILALTSSELGVNSFTINLILLTAIVVLLALPTFFLFKSSQGKSAVSKKTEVENIESEKLEPEKLEPEKIEPEKIEPEKIESK